MTNKLWIITIIAAVLAGAFMSSGTFFWIIVFALAWANLLRLLRGLAPRAN